MAVRLWSEPYGTGPYRTVFLLCSSGTCAGANGSSPIDGVLENGGDFSTPKQGWPVNADLLASLSARNCCCFFGGGNAAGETWGWEIEASAVQSLKISKVEANTSRGAEEVTPYAGSPGSLAALPGGFPAPVSGGSGPSHAALTFLKIPSGAGTGCLFPDAGSGGERCRHVGRGLRRSLVSQGGFCT